MSVYGYVNVIFYTIAALVNSADTNSTRAEIARLFKRSILIVDYKAAIRGSIFCLILTAKCSYCRFAYIFGCFCNRYVICRWKQHILKIYCNTSIVNREYAFHHCFRSIYRTMIAAEIWSLDFNMNLIGIFENRRWWNIIKFNYSFSVRSAAQNARAALVLIVGRHTVKSLYGCVALLYTKSLSRHISIPFVYPPSSVALIGVCSKIV